MTAFFIVLCLLLVGYVIYSFIKERRNIRRKTVESIGKELWKEIDTERQDSLEKGKKFRKVLDEAKKHR